MAFATITRPRKMQAIIAAREIGENKWIRTPRRIDPTIPFGLQGLRSKGDALNEMTSEGMHHCLEPAVRPQLLINVVQVIP